MTKAQERMRDKIRVAGYHGDKGDFMRLYVEQQILKFGDCQKAWNEGVLMKRKGVACSCRECSTLES